MIYVKNSQFYLNSLFFLGQLLRRYKLHKLFQAEIITHMRALSTFVFSMESLHLCVHFADARARFFSAWHTPKSACGRLRWHTVTVQLYGSGANWQSSPSVQSRVTGETDGHVRARTCCSQDHQAQRFGKATGISDFILGWITFGASVVRCASPPLIRWCCCVFTGPPPVQSALPTHRQSENSWRWSSDEQVGETFSGGCSAQFGYLMATTMSLFNRSGEGYLTGA